MSVLSAGIRGPSVRASHYVVPVLLMVLLAAVGGVVLTDPFRSPPGHHHPATHTAVRKIPPYWFVRNGDTLAQISLKTGLSVAQVEALNPDVDPNNLIPGERLKLWRHPPVPPPPSPGPMWWTVKPGQSFGSVAAATGVNIITLEKLNPNVKPASIQPGQRLQLHPLARLARVGAISRRSGW